MALIELQRITVEMTARDISPDTGGQLIDPPELEKPATP